MSLRVAIKIDGKLHPGRFNDSHDTLTESAELKNVPESAKGFTDGKLFLTRQQAVRWVAINQPQVFKKLIPILHPDGLFSADYAEALGIKQAELKKPEKTSIEKAPDVSKKKVIVYDYGYHTYYADRLAREFGEVFYYRGDWRSFFPTKDKQKVGHGFDSYERILKFWDYVGKVDLIIFTGLYDADLQRHLEKECLVFGPRGSELTEIDKWLFTHILQSGTGNEDKELLKQHGLEGISVKLPIIPTTKIVGLDNLKVHCRDKKDLYITPRYTTNRGDMETEHLEDWEKFKTVLRELSYECEYEEEEKEFIVRPKVESSCESGYDEYQVDGQSSPLLTIGNEYKDETYICKVVKLSELPTALEKVRSAMSQVYKRLGYRGNHSTEIRFDTSGTGLFIDDTDRIGQPPGEIWSELWKRPGANMYQVAEGKIPDMEEVKPYAAQINLHSPWLKDNWVPVKYPKEVAQWVKLRNNTIIGKDEFCLPFDKETTLGAIIGLGNSADEAVKECLDHLEEFWGHKVHTNKHFFDDTKKAMQAGAKYGIKL